MKVICREPEGLVEHEVWPFSFTKENTIRLYNAAKPFPVLFERPLSDITDLTSHFLTTNLSGDIEPQGLIWVIDDFKGIFYLNNIREHEADVHYSFFDRRHKGRVPLVHFMLKHVFSQYGFVRLNAYVPAYAGIGVRRFIEACGFKIEGRKRKTAWWKDTWFDTYLYGILAEEMREDGSKD